MAKLRSLASSSLPHIMAVTDQGLSSLSNLVCVVAVARALGASDFGIFSLGYTGLTLALGLSRAFFGMPISIGARDGKERLAGLYARSMSGALLLSLPTATVIIVIGMIGSSLGGHLNIGWMAVAVAAAAPFVVLQDIGRFYVTADGRPRVAVLSDGIWLFGMVLLVLLGDRLSPFWFSVCWLAVIVVSFSTMAVCAPWRNSFRSGLALLKPQIGLRESVAITVLLSGGTVLLVGLLITPFFGAGAVGSLRGASTLFGPINTLIIFLDFGVLTYVTRRPRDGHQGILKVVLAGLLAIELVWAAVLLLIPGEIGELLLGDTWNGARSILPVTSTEYFFLCITAGMALILKARGHARQLLVNKVLSTAIIIAGSAIAVALAAQFIAVPLVMALAAVVGAGSMFLSVRRSFRKDARALIE